MATGPTSVRRPGTRGGASGPMPAPYDGERAEAAARYIAGTPLRGDGQREISAVEFDSCQVFAAKDLQQ